MPKLIRKQKLVNPEEAPPATTTTKEEENNNNNNNNDNNDEETMFQAYERMNPRYADATATATAASLQDKIQSRIGSYIEEPWKIIGSYFEGKHLEN